MGSVRSSDRAVAAGGPAHRRLLVSAVALVLVAAMAEAPAAATPPATGGSAVPAPGYGYVPDQLAVTLAPGGAPTAVTAALRTRVDVRARQPVGDRHWGVRVDPGQLDEAMALLSAHPAVAAVDRVPRVRTQALPVVPNDPLWGEQWGSRQIFLDQAWTTTTGSSDTVVAVLDTGVDEVADLAGRVLPGRSIVDGDDDPYDAFGHGTMVATVLAGAHDNGVAGAGACRQCAILPVKVLDDQGFGSILDVAAGIDWAVANGADVINLSLGGTETVPALEAAVAAAEDAGVLVVAAAGNVGTPFDEQPPVPIYPAALPTVVSVGASGRDGRRMYWSNHGPHVDVSAPGCDYGQNRHRTGRFCGTSNASPMAAGVVALAMSQAPGLDPEAWRELLADTSVAVGDWLVAGRVDALALLAREDTVPPTAEISAPADGTTVTGQFTVTAAADDDFGVRWVELLADGEVIGGRLPHRPYEWTLWAGALPAGESNLTVRAGDGSGQTVSAAVPVHVGADEPPPPPLPEPPPGYTYTDLGVLDPPGFGRNTVRGMSNAGHVVGSATRSATSQHGYLWHDGGMTDLGKLGGGRFADSHATGVNDHGTVVGSSSTADPTALGHAFRYQDGEMVDLGTGYGPGSGSSAVDINNDGLIVGNRIETQESPREAVIWQDGEIRYLGTLGGDTDRRFSTRSEAFAVNNHGQVVGRALPAGGTPLHGFLWEDDEDGGSMTDLGTLGGNHEATTARDINDHGQVTGDSSTADGRLHAFRWDDGEMTDLGALGDPDQVGVPIGAPQSSSFAQGINNAGQVVGTAAALELGLTVYRAFLWDGGNLHDLHGLVTDLPAGVGLRGGQAIDDAGNIIVRVCPDLCATPGSWHRSYLLVPHGGPAPLRTTLLSGPGGEVTSSAATVEFTANDPAATFECALDGAPFAPCASPHPLTSLAPGEHTLQVRAINATGPDPTPATRTWTVTDPGGELGPPRWGTNP